MSKPKKQKRVQIYGLNGNRPNLKFPATTTKNQIEDFKRNASALILAMQLQRPFTKAEQRWLKDQPESIRGKLRLLGIIVGEDPLREERRLDRLTSRHIKAKRNVGEGTIDKLTLNARRLEKFLGADRDIREITDDDAAGYCDWLVSKQGLDPNSSARRALGYAHEFFERAVRDGHCSRNPFKGRDLPKNVKPNEDKHHYICPEQTRLLWSVLQCDEDRMRFVLMRYLGLRSPSEMNQLTWADVDWSSNVLTIRSPKLKRYAKKYSRRCPFSHPDVLPVFKEAYARRESDKSQVVERIAHAPLTRKVQGWLGAAGLDLWPDLLTNFRRTAVTDACDIWPSHVVAAYFGHSEVISKRHYRMTHDAHAAKAATATPLIQQNGVA